MSDTPIYIGVTGHRDIQPDMLDECARQCRMFFEEIINNAPDTPLKLISGLADGADRLAVKIALELGIDVEAVLPMPQAMYEMDFNQASLAEFRKMLEDPKIRLRELPLPDGIDEAKAGEYGPERDKLYGQLGDYLVKHSGLLLAFWDGVYNHLLGGTSDVLMRYLWAATSEQEGPRNVRFVDGNPEHLDSPEIAFWIPVLRQNNEQTEIDYKPSDACYLGGRVGPATLARYQGIPIDLCFQIGRLDRFNRLYKKLCETGEFFTWGGLLERLEDADKHPRREILEQLNAVYRKADGLALYNQKHSDRQFKLFSLMAAAMGIFFLVYAKIVASKILLILYLALFIAGIVMFSMTRKKHWFSQHLMDRVIAETLRTRFYLVLAGLEKRVSVRKLLNLSGINHFSGFSWILQIFRPLMSFPGTEYIDTQQQEKDLQLVRKQWLEEQAAYFKKKVHTLHHHHHKLENIKNKLLLGSAIATVLLIFFKGFLTEHEIMATSLKTWLVFLMGLLPFWMGVWEIYQSKMATKELLWQYRNQMSMYQNAMARIEQADSMHEQQDILAELGEQSLMENYLWTIHRYHREHEPPAAG